MLLNSASTKRKPGNMSSWESSSHWQRADIVCSFRMLRCLCLLLGIVSVCCATSYDADKARLLKLVPVEIDALARASAACHAPEVDFVRADFDGDGSHRYVVASYFVVCPARIVSAVRVLKEVDGQLLLHQVIPGLSFRAGVILRPEVIDLENNGVPEIMFRLWKGLDMNVDYSLLMLDWNDGALRPLFTGCTSSGNSGAFNCVLAPLNPLAGGRHRPRINTRNGAFRDLYADGRLELASPLCVVAEKLDRNAPPATAVDNLAAERHSKLCPGTRWYSYHAGEFDEIKVLTAQVELARVTTSGKNFSLAEIKSEQDSHDSHKEDAQREFVVQLAWLAGPSKPASSREIRPETLLLGRTLRPSRVTIKPEEQGHGCKTQPQEMPDRSLGVHCFKQELLEARFDRKAVAQLLQKLQLARQLGPGDLVSIPLAALMDNGDYVATSVQVRISK